MANNRLKLFVGQSIQTATNVSSNLHWWLKQTDYFIPH